MDLVSELIKAFSKEHGHPIAQHMITVEEIKKRKEKKDPSKEVTLKRTLKELIKFSGKILTDLEMKK